MREYYDGGQTPELKIRLRLVGDGPEKPMYQELVEKYHLEEYVQFYPTMSGTELDELYAASSFLSATMCLIRLYNAAISSIFTVLPSLGNTFAKG